MSVQDERTYLQMTNAGENSSGSTVSEGSGSSAGNANPDPNENEPKADPRPADERISGSLKKSKSYASELGHLNEAELTRMSKQIFGFGFWIPIESKIRNPNSKMRGPPEQTSAGRDSGASPDAKR